MRKIYVGLLTIFFPLFPGLFPTLVFCAFIIVAVCLKGVGISLYTNGLITQSGSRLSKSPALMNMVALNYIYSTTNN